uniref:procollagen-proline 3-dioxygenase n=1 Tax=Ciona savignyi TaxID=51511 RepID=H2ZBI6_CIOSA
MGNLMLFLCLHFVMLSILAEEQRDSNVELNHMQFGSFIDPSSLSEPAVAEGPLLHSEVTMLSNSTQMGGPLRFAVDHFANEQQCRDLTEFALNAGVLGDGYSGKASPNTEHELFQGLSIYTATELAIKGKVPVKVAALYFDLSEQVRQQVKLYFKLEELYPHYTHLVCRTSITNQTDRSDLSLPIHADNCNLQPNGSCLKHQNSLYWRDYSAILYLNEDFNGGEFIMADSNAEKITMHMKPKCGRLAGFCSGKQCSHGIKPITKGSR